MIKGFFKNYALYSYEIWGYSADAPLSIQGLK